MDYTYFIWAVITFIEKRLKTSINYTELEASTGFSYRHIRETFKECTKVSLSRYILSRRIANAAFEMVHTDTSFTNIASEYGFYSYDTFTRAFKRETGITPSNFRKRKCLVGRRRLAIGVFGPAVLKDSNKQLISSDNLPEHNDYKDAVKTDNSCILFGVPKVQYSNVGATPFLLCLKSCLNYIGQNIDYTYLMAASGAAFRLRWNTDFWDGGNVDVMCIYEDKYEVFRRSFQAVGRKYVILRREGAEKAEFISFIKKEINDGRPVIALGIIGPPEACIITGYDNNCARLFGWNFFQKLQKLANPKYILSQGIAWIEVARQGVFPEREIMAQVSKMKPQLYKKIYAPLLYQSVTDKVINEILKECHQYLEHNTMEVYRPIISYLKEYKTLENFSMKTRPHGFGINYQWLYLMGIVKRYVKSIKINNQKEEFFEIGYRIKEQYL